MKGFLRGVIVLLKINNYNKLQGIFKQLYYKTQVNRNKNKKKLDLQIHEIDFKIRNVFKKWNRVFNKIFCRIKLNIKSLLLSSKNRINN